MTIDTTKPLELADGTPVEFIDCRRDGKITVNLPQGASERLGDSGQDFGRIFLPNGKHIFGIIPNLRNVIDEHQGVLVMPRTVAEWCDFAYNAPDKQPSIYHDVLDALGLIIPDDQKPPQSRAKRFEEETGIRAGKKVLAALEWAAKNPD